MSVAYFEVGKADWREQIFEFAERTQRAAGVMGDTAKAGSGSDRDKVSSLLDG